MDTKYRRHLHNRALLLKRCAEKELKYGRTACTSISREDMDVAIAKFLKTEAGAKYRPVKDEPDEPVKRPFNFRYYGSTMLTFEGAVRGLFVPPNTKNELYIASYIHTMLVKLKTIRNRAYTTKEILRGHVLAEAKKHTTPDVAERATDTILRWVYPRSNEADYFYPVNYDELKRGRKSTAMAGGGTRKPYETLSQGWQYPGPTQPDSEAPSTSHDDGNIGSEA